MTIFLKASPERGGILCGRRMSGVCRLTNNILALVPARRGSKGLPRKNLALVDGLPLISYTINAAIGSGAFSRVTVSTNDREVMTIASKSGVDVLSRPEELSNDLASADSVIAHFISERTPSPQSIIVYLQPTSPMRSSHHINQALALFVDKNPHALISVKRASPSIFKTYEVCPDGTIKGLFGLDAPYSSRQIFPEVLSPNGAIYIFRAHKFSENGQIPRTGVIPFEMDKQSSLDIDSPYDLAHFEKLLNSDE